MFVLLAVTVCGNVLSASAQNKPDTLCPTVEKLQTMLIAAEQGVIDSRENVKLKEDISHFEFAVAEGKLSIVALKDADEKSKAIISAKDTTIKELKVDKAKLETKVKRLQTGKKIVAGAGILLTIGALLFKK